MDELPSRSRSRSRRWSRAHWAAAAAAAVLGQVRSAPRRTGVSRSLLRRTEESQKSRLLRACMYMRACKASG
jgi:hypothetical protein